MSRNLKCHKYLKVIESYVTLCYNYIQRGGILFMEKTLTIQIKIPEEVNKSLRIEAIKEGLTLKQYCVKVLSDHAKSRLGDV